MSMTMSVEDAQAKLKELNRQLLPGDEMIITENAQPVATLICMPKPPRKPRVPGLGKGQITLLVEDDEHLGGFAEYLPVRGTDATATNSPQSI